MKIEVTPASLDDALALAENVSDAVLEDLERGWGVEDIASALTNSVYLCLPNCWSVKDEFGRVFMIFGVGADGTAWFVPSKDFDEIAFRFVRQSKKYISMMLEGRKGLYNYVHEDNDKMIRWLEWCGFTVYESENGYRRCEICGCQS